MAARQSKAGTRAELRLLLHLDQGGSNDTSKNWGDYLGVLGGGSIGGPSSIRGGGKLDRGVIHVHSLACKRVHLVNNINKLEHQNVFL